MKKKHVVIFIIVALIITISTIFTYNLITKNNLMIAKNDSEKIANNTDKTMTERKIFGEMAIGEGMTANDITIPENLINENYTSIVRVVVNEVSEEAHIIPPTEKYYNPHVGYKSINVNVKEVLYGNKQLVGDNTFYMTGGLVKISEIEKYMDEAEKIKMGISKLSQQEKEEYYIDYTVEHDFDLKPGEEYVLFLAKQTEDLYFIDAEGLGIFKEVENPNTNSTATNTRTYKNVLTGNIFNK